MKVISLKKGAKKGLGLCKGTAAVLATALAVVCFSSRIAPQALAQTGNAALAAAGFIMPDGAVQAWYSQFDQEDEADDSISQEEKENSESLEEPSQGVKPGTEAPQSEETEASDSSQEASSAAPSGEGSPIEERKIGNSGIQYENIFVKNSNQNHSVDIAAELEKQPAVKIKTDGTPQVLIYHTHTTESYLTRELSVYPSGTESRSRDNSRNIVMVGNAIEAQLKAAGIGVIHDTTCHDYPAYNGSYSRSAVTIEKNLEKYPTIQVTLDIHRDAMGASDGTRYKPTAVIQGKKAAQVMILSGCDDDGTLGFPDWEYNLRLGLRVQKAMADNYPDLARPLNFCARKYNLNMTKGSLLVEFGTEVNTLDEAMYSGELFGKSLAKVLLELT